MQSTSPSLLPPLTDGRIIRRYKRFLADVEITVDDTNSGNQTKIVVAHCPNTGAMTSCWQPGAPVQLSASTNPKRKLAWTLERIDMGSGWIGINTTRVNRYIGHFIHQQCIPELIGYTHCRAEPAYGHNTGRPSRFDFELSHPERATCFVEIKNATLFKDAEIQFPDAVTTRGLKHLELLSEAANKGYRAVLLFAVNRPEGNLFRIAKEIDPNYYQAFEAAINAGVEVIALRIVHTKTSVEPGPLLPLSLPVTF